MKNSMVITKEDVALNLFDYMQQKISLESLIAWAENALMEGDFQGEDKEMMRVVLGKICIAKVRRLNWEDCEEAVRKTILTMNDSQKAVFFNKLFRKERRLNAKMMRRYLGSSVNAVKDPISHR